MKKWRWVLGMLRRLRIKEKIGYKEDTTGESVKELEKEDERNEDDEKVKWVELLSHSRKRMGSYVRLLESIQKKKMISVK